MAWSRLLLCGLLAGGVWTALSIVAIAVFGQSFFSALPASAPARLPGNAHFAFIATNLVSGAWAVWLFSLVRPQQPRLLLAVAISALGWWVIVSQQSIKWAVLSGLTAGSVAGLGIATFVAMLCSVLVGAWAYERQPSRQAGKG